MKKDFFIGLATVALLTACSKDETIEVNSSNIIKFDNAFVDNSTRSFIDPSLTIANLNNFSVWAFMDEATGKVMADLPVTKSETNWTYGNPTYWVAGHTYTFEAIAPYNERIWEPTATGGDLTGINVKNNTGTQDILYATAQKKTPAKMDHNPGAVEFTFSHLLSKVKFTFNNAYTNENYTIKVKDIKITNAYKSGNFDMSSWTGSDETLTLNFGAATLESGTEPGIITSDQSAESNTELLLIPSPAEKSYNITFTAELTIGKKIAGTYNLTSTITNVALEKGKSYNFTASLDQTNIDPENPTAYPITFTVTKVEGWKDGGNHAQTVK